MRKEFFGLMSDYAFHLTDEVRSRVHPDDTLDDLWNDYTVYNKLFSGMNNDWMIDSFDTGDFDNNFPFKEIAVPQPFFGWYDILKIRELPQNNFRWTIVSKKLLEVLSHFRNFEYKTIPIRVFNRAKIENLYSLNVRDFENEDFAKKFDFKDNEFFEIQIHSRLSILDDKTNVFGSRKDFIFREGIDYDAAPTIFRDPKSPGDLIVKQEVREALEQAGIKGIRFTEPFAI